MLALMSWGSLAQPCGATIHPVSPPIKGLFGGFFPPCGSNTTPAATPLCSYPGNLVPSPNATAPNLRPQASPDSPLGAPQGWGRPAAAP